MHQDRFYISSPPVSDEIWIDGDEAHHILHVKRAKQGTRITLFDGKGFEYSAKITEISNDRLKVFIEQSREVDRETHIDITIAFSIPKGKHETFLIQKCAELGVKTLIPLHCERSIVDFREKSTLKIERWDKIAVEASKQCKRNFVTTIEDITLFDNLLKTIHKYDLSLIACTELHPGTLKSIVRDHPSAKKFLCLIGPEGGFTHKEIEMAEKEGCVPVCLGSSTLRIETAAIAISSMLLYAYSY